MHDGNTTPPDDIALGEDWRARTTSREAMHAACRSLAGRARREILVYGPTLADPLGDDPETIGAFAALARDNRQARIRIFATRQVAPRHQAPQLVGLWHQLSSYMEVREAAESEAPPPDIVFMLVDRQGLYYRPDSAADRGTLELNNGGEARRLGRLFEEQWRKAQPAQRHRRTFV